MYVVFAVYLLIYCLSSFLVCVLFNGNFDLLFLKCRLDESARQLGLGGVWGRGLSEVRVYWSEGRCSAEQECLLPDTSPVSNMSFLSGLKKAYESLEGEVAKTFDSSQSTASEPPEPSDDRGATVADDHLPSASEGGSGEKEREAEEENWGEWETQDGGGGTSKKTAERLVAQWVSSSLRTVSLSLSHPQP